jgi:hypothetical protein
MSVGADGNAAPDRWITEWGFTEIASSHLTAWWSPIGQPRKPRVGDIVIQASGGTGKLLGIFRVVREGGQEVPHPMDPKRWAWDVGLEPLVTWDGRYAPRVQDIGLEPVPRVYAEIDDGDRVQAVRNLIHYHLPALSKELGGQ